MQSLQPSAYAPYRDPRDYILSWTDDIWVNLGRLAEHTGRIRVPERGRRPW